MYRDMTKAYEPGLQAHPCRQKAGKAIQHEGSAAIKSEIKFSHLYIFEKQMFNLIIFK